MSMTIGPKGLALIKGFEGLRTKAYAATEVERAKGIWTIGYGHTQGVKEGDEVTEQEAESLLRGDLWRSELCVNGIGVPLTQHQFDALVSLVFNVGPACVARGHTIGDALRQGDQLGASFGILLWNKQAGKVLPGLKRRREAEKALFDLPVESSSAVA